MKIHIIYEHVEREIYCAFLIKYELEKRGHEVEIFKFNDHHIPYMNTPDLIIMPWFTVNSQIEDLKIGYIGRIKKVLNLQFEQVMSQMWLNTGFHIPSGLTKNANHICWGSDRKKKLIENGVPEKNLKVIGDIRQDFCKKEFRPFFKTKHELSEEFNIPENHEWNLFISSFSFSKPLDQMKSDNEEIMGKENAENWQKISKNSQIEILNWIEQYVLENPTNEFIYRPHPSEIKGADFSSLSNLDKKYSNFHFIFNYSVQDWIINSDYVNTWISTSIIECYKLNKICNILRPIKIDENYDIPFYINATHISDYDTFKEKNSIKTDYNFPITNSEIKKYYENIDNDEFIYKKICDYIEYILINDKEKSEFYYYNPFIDNLIFTIKKLIHGRIPSIVMNLIKNKNNDELKNVSPYDYDKIGKIKKIIENN